MRVGGARQAQASSWRQARQQMGSGARRADADAVNEQAGPLTLLPPPLPPPQELKGFLGIDLHLPSDSLPLTNWKHNRGGPDAVRAAGGGAGARVRRCAYLASGTLPSACACMPFRLPCLLALPTLVPSLPHPPVGPQQLGRYWNMTRSEYEHLVDLARRNARE